MLFVSRTEIIDFGVTERIGVVDTDDDVETIVGVEELSDIVLKYNLEIAGVTVEEADGARYVGSFEVYQHPSHCSKRQIKAKTLLGIDIRTYRSEITYISVNGNVAKQCTRVRLSDYAKSMAWGTVIWFANHKDGQELILVLDDKIRLTGDSPNVYAANVRWDIREVTNEELVSSMYEALLRDEAMLAAELGDHLIDTVNRNLRWRDICHERGG